jgi:hypothetical protein
MYLELRPTCEILSSHSGDYEDVIPCRLVCTNISEEPNASIIRVDKAFIHFDDGGICTRLHGLTFQKTVMFKVCITLGQQFMCEL